MTVLHQRLLSVLDADEDPSATYYALRAVVELHAPVAVEGVWVCRGCSPSLKRPAVLWADCPTVKVVAEGLGVPMTPVGFGRRNPHCSNCGDERGGPFGHEISECRYRSGMTAAEVAALPHLDQRGPEFWNAMVDRYLSARIVAEELGVETP